MAIGATLNELVLALRAEMMQSPNPAHGVNTKPAHVQALQRAQRHLWLDFDWPHMRVDRDVTLVAGQRYYDLPADLGLDRLEEVAVKWSGKYHSLARGIEMADYNAFDSDADIRADPAWKWAPYAGRQFEVWPMPASNGMQTVRFRGIRDLGPLVNDDDVCDLDGDAIVLTVASELVSDKNRQPILLRRAGALLAKLHNRSEHNTSGRFTLGGRPHEQSRSIRRMAPLVAVDRGN